jgi:hypothetical protein
MSDDHIGIVSGDVKKLASHLHSLLAGKHYVNENAVGFLMQYNNYCLNKTKEIHDELNNEAKYPQGKQVFNVLMNDIIDKLSFGGGSKYKVDQLGSFLFEWLTKNPEKICKRDSFLIPIVFDQMCVDDFKKLSNKISINPTDCKQYLGNFAFYLKEELDDYYSNLLSSENNGDILSKLACLAELDLHASHPIFWKCMQAIFELYVDDNEEEDEIEEDHEDEDVNDKKTLTSYVFLNQKQLRNIKAKYSKNNPFEELLSKATDIYDCIVESNVIHHGVDRIIMEYL